MRGFLGLALDPPPWRAEPAGGGAGGAARGAHSRSKKNAQNYEGLCSCKLSFFKLVSDTVKVQSAAHSGVAQESRLALGGFSILRSLRLLSTRKASPNEPSMRLGSAPPPPPPRRARRAGARPPRRRPASPALPWPARCAGRSRRRAARPCQGRERRSHRGAQRQRQLARALAAQGRARPAAAAAAWALPQGQRQPASGGRGP
ncbi:unnamed protein product [Prorocentrum cordatum]|uniref:Uncharacterized protein n=1 Tax=Prorocentrum cordatum TaxID=2364126 RepID=A0ABN9XMZ9_9DINO|nr:unnamed protein product [Polarella glacialis]